MMALIKLMRSILIALILSVFCLSFFECSVLASYGSHKSTHAVQNQNVGVVYPQFRSSSGVVHWFLNKCHLKFMWPMGRQWKKLLILI